MSTNCQQHSPIILLIFNFIVFICGFLLFVFGVIGVASPQTLTYFLDILPGVSNVVQVVYMPELIMNSSIYMIIIGLVMILFGFIGCYGVLRENVHLLFVYWTVMIVILIAQIGLIIFSFVDPYHMTHAYESLLYESLINYFQPAYINPETGTITLPTDPVAAGWVAMQFQLSCCGAYDNEDYLQFDWNNTFVVPNWPTVIAGASYPPSCCMQSFLDRNKVPTNINSFEGLTPCLTGQQLFNTKGCYAAVVNLIDEYNYIAVGIVATVIAFQIFCIIAAYKLWRAEKAEAPHSTKV